MIAGRVFAGLLLLAAGLVAQQRGLVTGLSSVSAIAPDTHGDLYIADSGAIKKWNHSTGLVTTLLTGLNAPTSLAVDAADNLYFPDAAAGAIKEWNVARGEPTPVVTGIQPMAVAFDHAGNLLFTDASGTLFRWDAAMQQAITLCPVCFDGATTLAVDAQGNVSASNAGVKVSWQWSPITKQVTRLAANLTDNKEPVRAIAIDQHGVEYVAYATRIIVTVKAQTPGAAATLGTSSIAVGPQAAT
jgi:hypothetical protein